MTDLESNIKSCNVMLGHIAHLQQKANGLAQEFLAAAEDVTGEERRIYLSAHRKVGAALNVMLDIRKETMRVNRKLQNKKKSLEKKADGKS